MFILLYGHRDLHKHYPKGIFLLFMLDVQDVNTMYIIQIEKYLLFLTNRKV